MVNLGRETCIFSIFQLLLSVVNVGKCITDFKPDIIKEAIPNLT